jgi:hypothetical protein
VKTPFDLLPRIHAGEEVKKLDYLIAVEYPAVV